MLVNVHLVGVCETERGDIDPLSIYLGVLPLGVLLDFREAPLAQQLVHKHLARLDIHLLFASVFVEVEDDVDLLLLVGEFMDNLLQLLARNRNRAVL